MRLLFELTFLSLIACFLVLAPLFAIDMEVARRDYNKIVSGEGDDAQVSGCIFPYSCNKYNDLLIAHFHW